MTEGNRVISAIRGTPRILRNEDKYGDAAGLEHIKLKGSTDYASQREQYFGGGTTSTEAPDAGTGTQGKGGVSMGVDYSISKSLGSGFQHWDSGGGQRRVSSDYKLEGTLRRSIPNYGTAPALTPDSAQSGGNTTIINAPDNSTAIATSTNNQLNQEPHWSVHHTPVYQRGRYAA